MKPSIIYAFEKVRRAIQSSETLAQICTANKMRIAFDEMFVYGRLAHATKDHDKARFYADKLMGQLLHPKGWSLP